MVEYKDTVRPRFTHAELYRHYQLQVFTLNHELAVCLYGANESDETHSLASIPCVPIIIDYLQLIIPNDYSYRYAEPDHSRPNSIAYNVRTCPAPVNLLKRKAMALLGWHVDAYHTRKQGGIMLILRPANLGDTRSAVVLAKDCHDKHRHGIPMTMNQSRIMGQSQSPSLGGNLDHIVQSLLFDTPFMSTKGVVPSDLKFEEEEFGFLLKNLSLVFGVTSIMFSANSVESQIDLPGQIAPYGSCGDIPGVAHFYPNTPFAPCQGKLVDYAPIDELIVIDPPIGFIVKPIAAIAAIAAATGKKRKQTLLIPLVANGGASSNTIAPASVSHPSDSHSRSQKYVIRHNCQAS